MIRNIINKLRIKHFAVFFDENGRQQDIISIPTNKNDFTYKDRKYFNDSEKYTTFEIGAGWRTFKYWFYDNRYSEPLYYDSKHLAYTKNRKPYIAEQIQTLLDTKVLADINRKKSKLLELNTKTILMGLAIVGVAIYLLLGGGA